MERRRKTQAVKAEHREKGTNVKNEVNCYFLPLEEIHAKYGKPGEIDGKRAPRSFGLRGNFWG